jgi:hypothetical protein
VHARAITHVAQRTDAGFGSKLARFRAIARAPRNDVRQRGRRVLGIAVAQIVLHRAQIGALTGKVIATGVAEHVRPDATELRLLASRRG